MIEVKKETKIPGTNIILEPGDKIMEFLVNKQIINTKQGKIEIIKPNKNGDIILPKDWYDEEDEIYNDL